jgi:acetyl esterase/lipase
MKPKYPIDPSLQFYMPEVLPFSNKKFVWLFKYMNAGLRVHNWLSGKMDRNDVIATEVVIPGASGVNVPALLLRPSDIEENSPLLIYYHGGGFALTYAPLHLRMCKHYAREARCTVLLPDYRLTPSYGWPDGFNDSFRALEWAVQEAGSLKIDPRRMLVGGDSAGGALAAGVAQKARDMNILLAAQMLIYPMLDCRGITPSANRYKTTPLWTTKINRNAWDLYLGSYSRDVPPAYAAPGLCESLQGLPAAYIETAEFDPLHDEDVDYAKALSQAGVTVVLNETQGTFHGFEIVRKSPLVALSMNRRVAFLKEHI